MRQFFDHFSEISTVFQQNRLEFSHFQKNKRILAGLPDLASAGRNNS
ncbi:hypothetical protein C723_0236 [Christiangramia flava JLT2011]|uniref:Uncharacterized protein n=1 Tax=Christiangramia flava JLT2011 TaxID=1229726 RepID=A0A1L7I5J1_9FLAO|nr:hypothetical protein GRFL_1661 [Christiangramia flava JLT2011]OSS40827.1 hypothetical protein C723_0236 [Christiangramia flava JLT2011]